MKTLATFSLFVFSLFFACCSSDPGIKPEAIRSIQAISVYPPGKNDTFRTTDKQQIRDFTEAVNASHNEIVKFFPHYDVLCTCVDSTFWIMVSSGNIRMKNGTFQGSQDIDSLILKWKE